MILSDKCEYINNEVGQIERNILRQKNLDVKIRRFNT